MEIPLVSQAKSNHNICDISMEGSSEVLPEYTLEKDRTIKKSKS